jgi:hypothetical protein
MQSMGTDPAERPARDMIVMTLGRFSQSGQ